MHHAPSPLPRTSTFAADMIPVALITMRPCSPPLLYRFERWLGRTMSARERAVVILLEHQRARQHRGAYLLVSDPGSSDDVKKIIVDYLRWYADKVAPDVRPVVVTHGPKEQAQLLPRNDRRIIRRTSRSYTSLSPARVKAVALLDIDRWGVSLRPRGSRRAFDFFEPLLDRTSPDSIFIVHGKAGWYPERPPRHHFYMLWTDNFHHARHYITLDIPTLSCNLDADRLTPACWFVPTSRTCPLGLLTRDYCPPVLRRQRYVLRWLADRYRPILFLQLQAAPARRRHRTPAARTPRSCHPATLPRAPDATPCNPTSPHAPNLLP